MQMSAFPFLITHFFPHNTTKVPTPFISSALPKPTFKSGNSNRSAKIESPITEHEIRRDSHTRPSKPGPNSGSTIKAPTAPWMDKPLLVKPSEIMEFRKLRRNRRDYSVGYGEHPDTDLTAKIGGGRGRVAMKKIFRGIEKLRDADDFEETKQTLENPEFIFAPGDLWGNGDSKNDAEFPGNHDGSARECLEGDEFDIPLAEVVKEVRLRKFPWERDEKIVIPRVRRERVSPAAELSLDGVLLERLRDEAKMITKWVNVKKAGVTQGVVDQVCFIWRNNELALLKFDVPLCLNMDRAREIVEMKTGGLVVWRNKDFLAVFRGCSYESSSKHILYIHPKSTHGMNYRNSSDGSIPDEMVRGKDSKWGSLHTASLYEREGDRLLDGLGPRFVDWWMHKPLPVDGDLLPESVPGFKSPFRICPPFTRSKLTDAELTYLRRISYNLPTHYVLGRNRKLHGLAASILKLWEKCQIANIALKWGVPNTDNEQMANELKILTGGVILLRNKFLIILYRGKDFIPSEVAKSVNERETEITRFQLQEEASRRKASETFSINSDEQKLNSGTTGTLSEFHSIHSDKRKGETEVEVQLEAERERLEIELRDHEQKHFILNKKIERSSRILMKLNKESEFSEKDPDVEIISEEERRCLREMGLKINSSLVLGRRGVFDGVIEGMHQQWKHREVVKVITMQRRFTQVMHTAKCIEIESGGTLVSVVRLKEGHAIIVYRGKNYKRPNLAAINLLNKREALSRSLEIQRLGSLKFFASQKEQSINDLRCKLAELNGRIIDCRS